MLADDGNHHYVILSVKELKGEPRFNGNLVSVSAGYSLPRLCIDAARHGPSGANAQPWHFIVVTDPQVKHTIAEYFVAEQAHRARLGMKFPTPNYHGLATAPGFVVE